MEIYRASVSINNFPTNSDGSIKVAEQAALTMRVHEYSANIIYLGEATIGSPESNPVWKIKKLDDSSGVMKILYADGNGNFDNIWDNHLILNYL